jgi:hypothetical protein
VTTRTLLTDQQLDEIEALTSNEHLTPGPWTLDRESCDCGGDYPCGHGAYVTGVVTPVPTEIAAERCQRTGEQPRDYDFHRNDIGDFPEADWELMVAARDAMPALVAEVRRLRAELAEQHSEVAKLVRWRQEDDAVATEQRATIARLRAELASPTAEEAHVADDSDDPETGTSPCGYGATHDGHEWTSQPDIWCPGS